VNSTCYNGTIFHEQFLQLCKLVVPIKVCSNISNEDAARTIGTFGRFFVVFFHLEDASKDWLVVGVSDGQRRLIGRLEGQEGVARRSNIVGPNRCNAAVSPVEFF